MKRGSGVLMHVSSLPGRYSIGGFSESAKAFIDILHRGGFSYWQTLPFCPTDECNSPYKSCSAFGGNPYFVDLDMLCDMGLITKIELLDAIENDHYSCEFSRLQKERVELLRMASSRADAELKNKIREYIAQDEEIAGYCRFMALKMSNGMDAWYDWKIDEYDESDEFAWQFIEYFFDIQWQSIKKYANDRGIKIIGDIPIYVSYDSCDVWKNREQFDLDENGRMRSVAGCPPDYFAKDGQLWGNPIYDWKHMKNDGYAWWKKRMEHMLKRFDGVRIDHFRAFDSYWSIPADAESAKDGCWKKGPGRDFIRMLKETANGKLIIAEDLGEITDSVRRLVDHSGFPGMRVLQFGFSGERDSIHAPHNYIKNSVAYTGTHDNNTLLGFVWESTDKERRDLLEYCGYTDDDWDCETAYDAIISTVMSSVSDIVIFPIQDILYYGADTRMNTPGTSDKNWSFRLTQRQIDCIDTEKYRRLNELYCRA